MFRPEGHYGGSTLGGQDRDQTIVLFWIHYKVARILRIHVITVEDSIPSNLKDNLHYVRLNLQVDCPLSKLDDVDEIKRFQRQIKTVLSA